MKKDVKLYNVLFPFWMLLLFPEVWIVVLPGNFIIDSILLIISMFALKIARKRQFYKDSIIKIFCIGIVSDLVGAAYMLIMISKFQIGTMGDDLCLTLPALVISAILIFVFNFSVSFKNCDTKQRVKLSLIFAIVTAPYTFLVPSSWLYG